MTSAPHTARSSAGTDLDSACAGCGGELPDGARFCGTCGTVRHAPSPAPHVDARADAGPPADAPADTDPPAPIPVPMPVRTGPAEAVVDAFGLPAPALPAPPGRRVFWVVGAGVLCAAVLLAGCVVAITAAGPAGVAATPAPAPTTEAPYQVVRGLPGWSDQARVQVDAEQVEVFPDGSGFLTITGTTATVYDSAGTVWSRVELAGGDATVHAGYLDTVPADPVPAVAVLAGGVFQVWAAGQGDPAVIEVPSGAVPAVRSGTLAAVSPGNEQVWRLTGDGFIPYLSPRPGTVPLGFTGDTAVWASSRAEILHGTAAGTATVVVKLVPPVPDATIAKWRYARDVAVVDWQHPDGTLTTATHDLGDGHVIAAAAPAAAEVFVAGQDGAAGMLGDLWINLTDGSIRTVAGFTASRSVGQSFYGSANQAPAVSDGTTVTEVAEPSVLLVGVLDTGDLLVRDGATAVLLPTTNRKEPN